VLSTDIPTRDDLVRHASGLAPLLRKHAAWSEEHRRTHDEVIEAFAGAGIFRMRTPFRYGGYESDSATLVDVGAELGAADASASWTASVYWIPTWMVGMFPDHVQEEVFATPDVRVCGTLSPTGTVVPTAGGVLLNGRWKFISGALHSHWQEIIAVHLGPDGPTPMMLLVPISDLKIIDDWYTSGLSGTGSVSTAAQDVFVPQDRVVPLGRVLEGRVGAGDPDGSRIHRAPLLPVASVSSVGTVLGLARAAEKEFFTRLPDRKITYTGYDQQRDAPLTHLQVAQARMTTDEAEFHARRLAELVDRKVADDSAWTMEERALARADMGSVCRLAKTAVDLLNNASGGSSIYSHVNMQRINRDVQAVNLHALMHPDTNSELYGRILCGLAPDTLYI
jgi:alkylation response protein AidB-like acyl-CoA dehydrogenase